jgi:hypothetical protein
MRRNLLVLFAMLALVSGCADLVGPTKWHENYGSHDLVAWDGEALPTAVGTDGGAVVKGCIMLDAQDHFLDTYVHQYTQNGEARTQNESFPGTWKLIGDSIYFEIATPQLRLELGAQGRFAQGNGLRAVRDQTVTGAALKYAAKYDAETHSFTLVWQDYKATSHTFTYQRKSACR